MRLYATHVTAQVKGGKPGQASGGFPAGARLPKKTNTQRQVNNKIKPSIADSDLCQESVYRFLENLGMTGSVKPPERRLSCQAIPPIFAKMSGQKSLRIHFNELEMVCKKDPIHKSARGRESQPPLEFPLPSSPRRLASRKFADGKSKVYILHLRTVKIPTSHVSRAKVRSEQVCSAQINTLEERAPNINTHQRHAVRMEFLQRVNSSATASLSLCGVNDLPSLVMLLLNPVLAQ